MNIALIGGSGFIGTTLVRALTARGHIVRILDKSPSAFHNDLWKEVDVRDPDGLTSALSGEHFDAVYNLAAEHKDNVRPVSLYDEVNVDGARNVCAAADRAGIPRIVFTSSVAVYGFAPPNTGEDGAINPFNDYGRTKAIAESVYREWAQADARTRSLVIVRPTVVFGPRNRGNVYNLLRQIASGKFVMIGRGDNRKSMAYVDNVAAFLHHALTFGPGTHTYNYVDKPDLTMNELVGLVRSILSRSARRQFLVPFSIAYPGARFLDLVGRLVGREFSVSGIRIKKFVATTQFSTSVHNLPGFTAPVHLRDGVARTVEHEFVRQATANEIEFHSE